MSRYSLSSRSGFSLIELMVSAGLISVIGYAVTSLMGDFTRVARSSQNLSAVEEKMSEIQAYLTYDLYNDNLNFKCSEAFSLIADPFRSGESVKLIDKIVRSNSGDTDSNLIQLGQVLDQQLGLKVSKIELVRKINNQTFQYKENVEVPISIRGLQSLTTFNVYGAELRVTFEKRVTNSGEVSAPILRSIPLTLIFKSVTPYRLNDCFINEFQDDKDCNGLFGGNTFDKKNPKQAPSGTHCRIAEIASNVGNLEIQPRNSDSGNNQTSMILKTNGSVGIGTIDPASGYILDIAGDVVVEGNWENTGKLSVQELFVQGNTLIGKNLEASSDVSFNNGSSLIHAGSEANFGQSMTSGPSLITQNLYAVQAAKFNKTLTVQGSVTADNSSQTWRTEGKTTSQQLKSASVQLSGDLSADKDIYATGKILAQGTLSTLPPSGFTLTGGACASGFMTGVTADGDAAGCAQPSIPGVASGGKCPEGQFVYKIDGNGNASCASETDFKLRTLQCTADQTLVWNSTTSSWSCQNLVGKHGNYYLNCIDVEPSQNEAGNATCSRVSTDYYCTSVHKFYGENNTIQSCDNPCSLTSSQVENLSGAGAGFSCVSGGGLKKIRVRCCKIATESS